MDNVRRTKHGVRRDEFNAMRRTKEFKEWWVEQGRCQGWLCAWCRKDIRGRDNRKEVDHVKPLLHYGANDYDNLVLSCPECNKIAGAAPDRVKPGWIKSNRFAEE